MSIQKEENKMNKKVKNYKFKTKPYAHQIKALELSWDKPYYAYFMEMGTGKSKVLLITLLCYMTPVKLMVY